MVTDRDNRCINRDDGDNMVMVAITTMVEVVFGNNGGNCDWVTVLIMMVMIIIIIIVTIDMLIMINIGDNDGDTDGRANNNTSDKSDNGDQ